MLNMLCVCTVVEQIDILRHFRMASYSMHSIGDSIVFNNLLLLQFFLNILIIRTYYLKKKRHENHFIKVLKC